MIPSALATVLLVVVMVCARIRGRRLRAGLRTSRSVAADLLSIERDRAAAHLRRTGELADELAGTLARLGAEQGERLLAEQDRDALQLIAAGHLRRAWRAERALTAVRARDEASAYAEQDHRNASAVVDEVRRILSVP